MPTPNREKPAVDTPAPALHRTDGGSLEAMVREGRRLRNEELHRLLRQACHRMREAVEALIIAPLLHRRKLPAAPTVGNKARNGLLPAEIGQALRRSLDWKEVGTRAFKTDEALGHRPATADEETARPSPVAGERRRAA